MVLSDNPTITLHDNEIWLDDEVSSLNNQGYSLTIVGENGSLVLEGTPDAVITTTEAACQHIHTLLSSTLSAPRPLIVLVSNGTPTESDYADAVLPAVPAQFSQLLKLILDLHKENWKLQLENMELGEHLAIQQRLADEVEIIKNAIVRNVSHELKTPLLQVKSAVALLAEDVKDEKLANYARGATARLETLVKNITLLGSSLDMNPSPVIVRDAIAYAKRNLGRIWEHMDARDRIKVHVEDNLPPVMADKQGLSTALQLLMDNALKFSKEDVTVYVRQVDNSHVEIGVTDHGIGIEQEHMDRIFQTFYQVDSSSTRRYGGTGVGLSIVQLILDHHQTSIQVESILGKGSNFSFVLPIVSI